MPESRIEVPSTSAPEAAETPGERPERRKLPYRPPKLTNLGDLRDLTLGPSAGVGESGNPVVFRA